MCFDLVVQLLVVKEGTVVKPCANDKNKIKINAERLNSAMVAISQSIRDGYGMM